MRGKKSFTSQTTTTAKEDTTENQEDASVEEHGQLTWEKKTAPSTTDRTEKPAKPYQGENNHDNRHRPLAHS